MGPRPPGPRINVLLGLLGFDPLEFARRNARTYGDVVYYKVGPLRMFQVSHPDLARQVLVEEPEKYQKPLIFKRALRPFAGQGLITSDGALWKQQRKLMQPAFHYGALAAYGDVMVAHARRAAAGFTEGEVIELQSVMSALTFAVVVECLFGGDATRYADEVGPLMVAVLDASNHRLNSVLRLPDWVPTPRHLRERRALEKLDGILNGLIAARSGSRNVRHDLLAMLLTAVDQESGARMSNRQLCDELMTLFLAGHETTANLLMWTWFLLSQHPEAEATLAGELDRVLRGRAPTTADLPNLPYTEMVIREALRMYPPAPGVAREPLEDVVLGGYEVLKGSLVIVNAYVMQRDERFFAQPERFDPSRFETGWEQRIPRYAYLPFGAGPRVCIGNNFAMMSARLILATVAQQWRMALEPNQQVVPIALVTVRARDGVRMKLTVRRPT